MAIAGFRSIGVPQDSCVAPRKSEYNFLAAHLVAALE
jgi:hypothetical protein